MIRLLGLTLLLSATVGGPSRDGVAAGRHADGGLAPCRTDMTLGISGHPLSAIAYNANSSTIKGISYDMQIEMLRELGLSVYRMDVKTNPSGRSVNHDKFMDILQKCQEAGITLLPMVYDRCRYEGGPAEAYREGYRQMAGFASLYGRYLTHFELGNEIELFDKLRIRGKGDGTREQHYDMQRVAVAVQYVRGMEEGLKSVLPGAKSMVNTAGFFPVFWMDQMLSAAPGIDICAWHVYPEMVPLYKSRYGIDTISRYLYERYGRPIWFTETNARARKNLTQEENEERAFQWRRAFTEACLADTNVKAVVYHELLDNPERGGLGHSNFEEEHFGFVRFEGYPGKADETAYLEWRSRPGRYLDWSYKKVARDLVALSAQSSAGTESEE